MTEPTPQPYAPDHLDCGWCEAPLHPADGTRDGAHWWYETATWAGEAPTTCACGAESIVRECDSVAYAWLVKDGRPGWVEPRADLTRREGPESGQQR